MAFSGDGRWLYVVESTLPGVSRLEVRDDATLGTFETVVYLQGTVPDGIAFDADGNLYIACYRPDRIYRYSRGGSLEILAEDPHGSMLNAPTNLAFAGPHLEHFVVANLAGWHLASSAIGVMGQRLACPDLKIQRT
jgi:gluconolactonase